MQRKLETARAQFARVAGLLDSLSPLRTVERGYAIITDSHSNIITSATDVSPGDSLQAKLARGQLTLIVDSVMADENRSKPE